MFRNIGSGTAIFTAHGKPLQKTQKHQNDWGRDTDRSIAWQKTDAKGGNAHQAHCDQKSVFTPNQITDAAKEDRTQRANGKAGCKSPKRQNEAGSLVYAREELRGYITCEQPVKIEIMPLEHRSKRRRQYDLRDRKSTRLNSSHVKISYAVFCLKKKKKK